MEPDYLFQVFLIPFHGKHEVASLSTHLANNRFLTPCGIDGHRSPTQIENLQQQGNGRYFVGMVRRLHLPQHYAVLRRPGVTKCKAFLPVVLSPE